MSVLVVRLRAVSAIAAVLLLSGGLARADLPQLIPREVLFGNPVRERPRLSPDGTQLTYLAPDEKGVLNVWVRSVDKEDAVAVTHDAHRGVPFYLWAEDGEHVLYEQDRDGDENWHVFSSDLRTKVVRDLTPFQGIRAQNLLTSPARPGEILVGLNLRKRDLFDMYRVNLATGAVRLDTENPGDVLSWSTDRDFVIRAATAFDPKTAETILRVRDRPDAPWHNVAAWPFEESTMFGQINGGTVVADFAPHGKSLYVVSSTGADTARVVRLDATNGRLLEVLAEHPQADVAEGFGEPGLRPLVLIDPRTHAFQAAAFEFLEYQWKFRDAEVQADFERLGRDHAGFLVIVSRDRSDRRWIVDAISADGPQRFLLYDRAAKTARLLFEDQPALAKYDLAKPKPLLIRARDGLDLVAYLTLPPQIEAKNLPLVVLPHGGPWARDDWGFDPFAQLLANRGYAVLTVNFRGSTGFGKKFLNAGNRQFGLGMQDDIADAAKWAVAQRIADPRRIGIMGASAGGYAALRGITRTPELYRCAVDLVGPSDLKLLFQTMPPGWGAVKTRWIRRMGDVEADEELNRSLSPLYHVEEIRVPVLIGQGANDPRVNIRNSDLIAEALRKKNLPVTYVVYSDEGHGFARPENNLDFFGRVEEFLAKNLGGRAEPWKKVDGSTAEVR
jgi:dipeptidyl aminopeptidase/acylaminoacyl peptidase